jgi:hypothetical protein
VMKKNRAQVTIFVILAILIVVGIGLYFYFKGSGIVKQTIPQDIQPVYDSYLSCIDSETKNGAMILGFQGGYIEKPEFSSGSEYMPFSSELDFLGTGVPYWYYISGNGIVKNQVPTKEKMQEELNTFLETRINTCDFSLFEKKGYIINLGESDVKTTINSNTITVKVSQDLSINFENSSWNGKTHIYDTKSSLGNFYDASLKIYNLEQSKLFLENYSVDMLRLYAPVDGSEIGCSPKLWSIYEIKENLTSAIEGNIPAIKIKGDYYSLSTPENKYFIQDLGEDTNLNINFMYSRQWPMKFEVWPSEDNSILRADPVGLQEGMGMLGFCYVPYHFIYDLAYPVLIQVYSGDEVFQFPVVVYINKNNPRVPKEGESQPSIVPELCDKKIKEMSVYTYNNNLEPIEAEIKFKCFDTTCSIGKTQKSGEDAVLKENFPECINGFVIATSNGYETSRYQIESLSENVVTIIMQKKYTLNLEIDKDSREAKSAIISFIKDDKTTTISYPDQKTIELIPGQYTIKVYVYDNASINFQGASNMKCIEVQKSGILGLFGASEEKCFNLNIPEQVISLAVSGGGTEDYFIGESELESSKKLTITADDFGIPGKIEDLQKNYEKVETSNLKLIFS